MAEALVSALESLRSGSDDLGAELSLGTLCRPVPSRPGGFPYVLYFYMFQGIQVKYIIEGKTSKMPGRRRHGQNRKRR
jgi:hypothetical protein